jgi:tRNA(Arg) A34 adenosine deaminase TadA
MKPEADMIDDNDMRFLNRAVELAEKGLLSGDEPFGSVLVSRTGEILFEDHNHVARGDATQHPELNIARWSAEHLSPEERSAATVYTSGEHCPMCAAAHAWVGLGRIVFAGSSAQLTEWLRELGLPEPPVKPLPINEVAPALEVEGPVAELASRVRELHRRRRERDAPS